MVSNTELLQLRTLVRLKPQLQKVIDDVNEPIARRSEAEKLLKKVDVETKRLQELCT